MTAPLFQADPAYRGQGQAQPQNQQRGFFDSVFSGFGLFNQQTPTYRTRSTPTTPPGGGTTPPTTGGGGTTTPPTTTPPTTTPPVVRTDAVWSTEIGCPHMDGKTLTKRGRAVEVPLPSWATKYRAEFSPVYPGPDAAEAKPPDYDHPLSAFAFGLSEPARGVLDMAATSRPAAFILTPHWIQASGNNSKADTIRAVLTVTFE